MESTSDINRRTPFLKRENIIVKYNNKLPEKKIHSVIPAQKQNPVKTSLPVLQVKPLIKIIPESERTFLLDINDYAKQSA